jgi:hypothetical protein
VRAGPRTRNLLGENQVCLPIPPTHHERRAKELNPRIFTRHVCFQDRSATTGHYSPTRKDWDLNPGSFYTRRVSNPLH